MVTNFKVGERVIFLNEKGGGVVTRLDPGGIIYVAVEDGFEIPYAPGDLLKSGVNDLSLVRSGQTSVPDENPDQKPLFSIPNKPDQLKEGVYLALRPTDQEQLTKSDLDVLLINHSQYQLLFSVYLNRSGVYHGLDFGFIEDDSQLLLTTIKRSEIEDWTNGIVQLVFFKEGKADFLQPASTSIAIKPIRIYSEESFQHEGLLRQRVIITELTTIEKQARNLQADMITADHIKQLQEKISSGARTPEKNTPVASFLDKHKVDDRIAEVDLHIGELSDDFRHLSNVQIIGIQMDYMKKCFDQAKIEKLKKIIFIHGVGNGTLKNELLRYLRNTSDIDFYDAPYARYGMGATEVVFYKHL
jgi:hypothetical protein